MNKMLQRAGVIILSVIITLTFSNFDIVQAAEQNKVPDYVVTEKTVNNYSFTYKKMVVTSKTTYKYDKKWNLKSETTEMQSGSVYKTTYTYDKSNNLIKEKSTKDGKEIHTITYKYNKKNQCIKKTKKTAATTEETTYTYNKKGQIKTEKVVDWSTFYYSYEYNKKGLIKKVSFSSDGKNWSLMKETSYDKYGYMIAETIYSNGEKMHEATRENVVLNGLLMSYDEHYIDNAYQSGEGGSTYTFEYDKSGNLIKEYSGNEKYGYTTYTYKKTKSK